MVMDFEDQFIIPYYFNIYFFVVKPQIFILLS